MFHKTSLKLAGLYLAIIMTISVFFSFSLYNISMREIERGFRRQSDIIQPGQRPGPGAGRQDFDEQRQDILDEARARVLRAAEPRAKIGLSERRKQSHSHSEHHSRASCLTRLFSQKPAFGSAFVFLPRPFFENRTC